MTLDEQISFCEEKIKNIKLKTEPQTFIDIKNSLEKLKNSWIPCSDRVPEECRTAVEKQTAKQIIDNTPTEDDMWYQCPACKGDLTKIRSFYCPYCGQRLSWNGKQYCSTCTWYDVDNGVCCNGENEHNRNLDDTCEKWEEVENDDD